MGKKKYSEVKHADKFYEALSAWWLKVEPHAWLIAIAMTGLLLVVAVWLGVSHYYTARHDRPWVRLFELKESASARSDEGAEPNAPQALDKLAGLAAEYQGRPVAAMALLDLTERQFDVAAGQQEDDPKAAAAHFKRAAGAAEQFIADFPDHPLLGLAEYQAGKARFALKEYDRAAEHFDKARAAGIGFLAVLAGWHAGRCYEHLGRVDEARRAYEAVRDNRAAGWCGELAESRLAQLASSAH